MIFYRQEQRLVCNCSFRQASVLPVSERLACVAHRHVYLDEASLACSVGLYRHGEVRHRNSHRVFSECI